MFKLESYITPILLSYVNRYINNFKLEDSQVSLWGGDASFHNLELNLQVLEQELQLPFSFVSGNIRELLIHVPWTKIASEPITITINTIECILNLKGKDGAARAENREKQKKAASHGKEVEAPQGYVQLLINKIVSNIRIYCNNVILKYVEEDIVLSMNVKHLKLESANDQWEPAYTDLSTSEIIIRKVITVNDLTLCLDRRNASGKIEVYQEPMLYRCSMTMHLLRHYHSATASVASTTRLDIYCNNMEFSMTEQQVPMLIRLLLLLYALQQRRLKPEKNVSPDSAGSLPEVRENSETTESWTGWAWSYVSSVLPTPWDEDWNNENLQNHKGHTLHFGFFVDNASITFKVSETCSERGVYYSHKKLRYNPMLMLQLQGMYSETVIHGMTWFNATGGVSQAILLPVGICSCSQIEIVDDESINYLKLGSITTTHKEDSLFDARSIENMGKKRQYNISWEFHMDTNTESVLLERTPAFAYDYLYQMEITSDISSDILSDLGSDNEFSNLPENSSMRICFGPFKLRLCSGLFHRLSTLRVAASYCDYPPYYTIKPDLLLQELLPPSEEDFDALNVFIPNRSMRITLFAPIIELELMDHPYFQPKKSNLFHKRKKQSSSGTLPQRSIDLPKLTVECQFLDITMNYPMYINRLVHTTCQLPDAPKKLFEACYSQMNIKIVGICSRLILSQQRYTTIMTPATLSFSSKSILKPQYWLKPDILHIEDIFESESITLNGTNAKIMVITYIIEKLIKLDSEGAVKMMTRSSILADASKDHGLPYMEFCIEGIHFKKVATNATVALNMSLGSIKAFIFEPVEVHLVRKPNKVAPNDIQQVLFISGPEPKAESLKSKTNSDISEIPLFSATMQYPLSPDIQKHPPILWFNLQEIRICVDPLLCKWLLYTPKQFSFSKYDFDYALHKTKSISEASGSAIETPKRLTSQIESVHSSSDREPIQLHTHIKVNTNEEEIDVQEKIYSVLKKWFAVWKGMYLCGDMSQCTVYFPLVSLSAVGSQGIQEAVDAAIKKESPLDILVITLPFANIRSSHRQSVKMYLNTLPVFFPENIWSAKSSSFPWTISISDLSCYTIQNGNKLNFLQPVSLNATVGLSTRTMKNIDSREEITTCSDETDISSLGICVHIDTTPIVVSTSEIQVYLFTSILYGLMEVVANLVPEKPKVIPKTSDIVPPPITRDNSTLSPTVLKENTIDSISEKATPMIAVNTENVENDSVKLTAWIQWTITRFTVELLSNEYNNSSENTIKSQLPMLKLVIDAEDIVSSLDFQSIYLKIKSKVGSISIRHFKRMMPSSKWKPGPFSGIVMRLRDDFISSQRHEDNGFLSITITRASCQHTHSLWGATQKRHKEDKKTEALNRSLISQSRYITEIVINVQPIDFIISLNTLHSFYLVMVPLLQIPKNEEPKTIPVRSFNFINNETLPLAYLDCQDIRVIMPSVELGGTGAMHDVIIFQVLKICLTPTAVNPICRTQIRPDLYEQAVHARILNIPGSDVEDRQYQVDVVGMSVCTGTWEDIDSVFSPTGITVSNLRGLSENPALEWNNLEQGQPNMTPILNLWNVTEKFDISVIAAPAMVYKQNTVICGHSFEVNFVSDIFINLSLNQIKLVAAILSEFVTLLEPLILDDGLMVRPEIKFPYSRFESTPEELEEYDNIDILRDSGVDTSDIKSVMSSRVMKTLTESDNYVFPRPPNPIPNSYLMIPIDMLFTGGKIGLALYQIDIDKINVTRAKGKKKKVLKIISDDLGYEAEEEGFDDKRDNYKKYRPLVYICVDQPNAFIAKQPSSRKIQVCCFDLIVKLSGPEYQPVSNVPTEDDFPIHILQTRGGIPDSNTGISPAFLTLKYTRILGKTGNLYVDISKPLKILCSTRKWGYLLTIKDKVFEMFKNCLLLSENIRNISETSTIGSSSYTKSRTGETYSKFQDIKDKLKGINTVNVKLAQIIFCLMSDSGHEIHLGAEKINSQLSLSNRPEKLTIICGLHCLMLSVINNIFKKILLNPWTISFDISIFWETWQNVDSSPQIHITAESDCIVLDIIPEQIKGLEIVVRDIMEFVSTLPFVEKGNDSIPMEPMYKKCIEKDQHYKDDLRAGAFQFVDANTESTDELPLPYQVMFWNKTISAMAWRYPQPRALTKVRIFPVPYKMSLGYQEDLLVLCHLEYWSDCRNCYLPFTEFFLSESEVCHLTIPEANPQPVVASTWRVVITMINESEDETPTTLISPRALAACMRIDSYFDKSLIPNITFAMNVTKIELSLYNHFEKNSVRKLPTCLKNYTSDMLYPESQRFLTITLDNLTAYCLNWDMDIISTEISAAIKCSILDYAFLTDHCLIEPFTLKLEVNMSDYLSCNVISKPIQIKLGPTIAHTLAIATQVWEQTYSNREKDKDFILTTRFIICNDTNVNIRFGQTNTNEDILLPSRHFHLYGWRSQKTKQQLKVALEEIDWIWSKSFTVVEDGMQVLQFNTEQNISLIILVESLSATQKKITVSGLLTVCNMLIEHFEFKVMEAIKENKEFQFKNTPTYIVAGRSSTPSFLMNNKKTYFLRLRFYGLESTWTGDIPLREHATGSQPWLVKVPLQERGQFLSIWCRIVTQEFHSVKRTLAMLWPLFMVRSGLPNNLKVHIETPTLKVHLDSIINGKGELQQLYCPGTIDHSHQLTLKVESNEPSASPYIPLNYSLVDQQKFFKKADKEDIDEIIKVLNTFNQSSWPYFGEELEDIDWIVEDQPLTHVQVRYKKACLHSCSLLVELLPWCLTINTVGIPISIALNSVELCRIQHQGIVAPPRLEENFNIGVCSGGSWSYSGPLQLAKSDWSQTFYMPKFTGTIPLEGSIKMSVKCDTHICMLSITSSFVNEIRLLKVSSTHILSNHMAIQVQVICFAVPEDTRVHDFPEDIEPYCFTVTPRLHKNNSGISIIQWHTLNIDNDTNQDYALYVSCCIQPNYGWSCPIRVDKPLIRKSFCVTTKEHSIPVVLTSQDYKGHVYLAIHKDNRPQLFIENKTGTTLFCAQSLSQGKVAQEVQHFQWYCELPNCRSVYYTMPSLSENFPELPQDNFAEKISLACKAKCDNSDTHDFDWSASISIINDNDQFVKIPYYGDIKVKVLNTACTTFLTMESVSQVEISARDIRVRLLMHENEVPLKVIEQTESTFVDSSKICNNEAFSRSLSETSIAESTKDLYWMTKQHIVDEHQSSVSRARRGWSDTDLSVVPPITETVLVNTLPMKEKWSSIKFNGFVKSFSVIFISDIDYLNTEMYEVASFNCDNIMCCGIQTENMRLKIAVINLQFDNQLCKKEAYDFPVVLFGQDVKEIKKLNSLNIPIQSLIDNCESDALLTLDIVLETWCDNARIEYVTGVKSIKIVMEPLSCYVEDTYITKLMDYLKIFTPTTLVLWPEHKTSVKLNNTSGSVSVPDVVSWQCAIISRPLTVRNITVAPISLLLSVHSSIKIYIALDQSPLQFSKFERKRIFTTPYRLGHALTMHYLSGAIFGAGWVVSSLELLGSPGGLARAMGTGLRDFVSLPYRGFVVGPMAFLRGITQGSASLMKHITAGTLQSVTKLASSVARNLDRLTLDEEHVRRTEEQRRQRPQGLTQGFIQGLTGLGISLLGAVGGIAHHPLQSMMVDGASPRSLAAGVGLGLVGMFTKPLSGAAELVALTGQGLLQGAGWNSLPEPRSAPASVTIRHCSNSSVKYNWKHVHVMSPSQMLYVTEATSMSGNASFEAIAIILTLDALIVINTDKDETERVISLKELTVGQTNDPTLLTLKLTPPLIQVKSECTVEMDPVNRARVAEYLKSTVGLLNLPNNNSTEHSEISISPLSSPSVSHITQESTMLTYYVNPQNKNYFLCLMELAKQQCLNNNFPVL